MMLKMYLRKFMMLKIVEGVVWMNSIDLVFKLVLGPALITMLCKIKLILTL